MAEPTNVMANDSFSYPPRGLSAGEAARYISVSTSKLYEMVADGSMPKPIKIGNRSVWDRVQIDEAFSNLRDQGSSVLDSLLK